MLKPVVTVDFAERIGHRFARDYGAGVEANTYASLLDLVGETRSMLEAQKPCDNIDVQSFIWIVAVSI